MNELTKKENTLPAEMADLSKFILVHREELVAVRAGIRAIEKVGLAKSVHEQKLLEAQMLAEAVLDAETQLGSLIAQLPESPGKRTDLQVGPVDSPVQKLTKREAIESIGISVKQAQRYETLAAHPEVVEQAKAEARSSGDIVSRTAVLESIKNDKKPFTVHNSGEIEWYTPAQYIDSARRVMGSIDLDPASSPSANTIIKAKHFYTIDDDGLKHDWKGNIWMNPPYADVARFVEKLCSSDISSVIVLVNNATDTFWFQKLIFHAGRIHFIRPDGNSAGTPLQGQAFVYIGDSPYRFLAEFQKYGWGFKTNS